MLVKIFEFREHVLTVKGEKADLIEMASALCWQLSFMDRK